MPRIGARYSLTPRSIGKVSAYGAVNLFMAFLSFDSSDASAVAAFEKAIESSSLFGLTLGFGAEYTIAQSFSISAEYGIRMLFASSEQTHTFEDFDPNTGASTTTTETLDVSGGLQNTYATVSLNYRF